jgi:hypothetical protein
VDVISSPRYEDFEMSYHDKNPWAHLGLGYSMKNHGKEWSPYLSLDAIDPKWAKAVGAPVAEESEGKSESGRKDSPVTT